jgi:hypothetical protein
MAGCRQADAGVAAPFQGVAGQHDGAGDQAVPAPLVVFADVDEQGAAGLGVECLGGRWAVRQRGPGPGEQLIDGLRGAASGHVRSPRSGGVVRLSPRWQPLQPVCSPRGGAIASPDVVAGLSVRPLPRCCQVFV